MRAQNRRGYTLIELVVTILIIGVLSSFAIPQYLRTVEGGKADDAVAIMNMVGTTNKMFALDHNGYYVYGAFPTGAGVSCASTYGAPPCAGAAACPTTNVVSANGTACVLVCCKYLADQSWGDKPYTVNACDPTGGSGGGSCAAGMVAATKRQASAYAPYNTWGYTMSNAGVITALNASTPPPTY
jgi:prepilin-type N-terminal cleavage/methylation domain-containing protein